MEFFNYLANNPFWFLIALGVFVCLVGVVCIVSRQTISEAALLYCGLLYIIIFFIYSTGRAYASEEYTWKSFFECLYSAIKSFGFELKFEHLDSLMEVSPVYSIAVFVAAFFAGLTLVIGVIEFATAALLNNIFVVFKMIGKKRDIVLGYGNDAFNYCRNNKNTILWIDSTVVKITRDDRKRLFREGILFIHKPFNTRYLKQSTLCIFKTVFVICFQSENEYFQNVLNTLEGFKSENKEYKFHVQTTSEHMDFMNHQLTKKCSGKGKVMAMTFEYHELISHNFSLEYNLAKYLPRTFVNEGTIVRGKNINLVVLGYGKTGKAMLKSILLNNQFVEKFGDFYRCKKINVHIYDKNKKQFEEDIMFTHIKNYEALCAKNYFNFDQSLGPIEMTAEVFEHVYNVKTDPEGSFYSSIKNQDDTFTYYIVALDDATDNLIVAESIARLTDDKHSVIFYNVDHKSEQLSIGVKRCIPFGFKSEILSHENITIENLVVFGQNRNKIYKAKASAESGFYESSIVEKLSNIYDAINHRFKLNIIGLDYVDEKNVDGITKEKYLQYYNCEPVTDYEGYFTHSLTNAMIYQEHLRWCMLYFLQGFKGMRLDEISMKIDMICDEQSHEYQEKVKPIHKNILLRKHACLTSFMGLDVLHRFEYDLYLKEYENRKYEYKLNSKKTIHNFETYKYDIKLDKAYDVLTELGYKVIKLEK